MKATTVRKKLLTVDEFAQAVGLKPETLRQKIWKRQIEFVRIGRNVRLRSDLVDELIENGLVPPMEAR